MSHVDGSACAETQRWESMVPEGSKSSVWPECEGQEVRGTDSCKALFSFGTEFGLYR